MDMRPSGVVSEKALTAVVFLVALGFMVMLAGGPSEFMLSIQKTLEPIAVSVIHMVHPPV